MEDVKKPIVEAQMLIRKPAAVVFEAFIDPAITSQFWFTRSSAPLAVGKTVTWEWEMYSVSTTVYVKEIVPHKLIIIEWGDPKTIVSFAFKSHHPDETYVVIKNYGFEQTGETLMQELIDNTGGFTTVLDGLKAYLEYGIHLNLIADKFPKAFVQHG